MQPLSERPRHHTPGPWSVSGNTITAPSGVGIGHASLSVPVTSTRANAQLMAAAPTLAAALEHVLDRNYIDAELRAIVEDALSRAIPEDRGVAGQHSGTGSGF